jgi:hypothetical protein
MATVNATITEPPTNSLITLQGWHGSNYVTFYVKKTSVTTSSGWIGNVTSDIKATTGLFNDVSKLRAGPPVSINWTGSNLMLNVGIYYPRL